MERKHLQGPQQGPRSLIKYEPPLDITNKLAAYQHKLYQPAQPQSKPSPQDLLNIMLPPRQYISNRQHFLQYVSHQPPQREDVDMIRKKLEHSLIQMQARVEGICPIKEQLISQTFDQIIRQVALDCPQRGLMLLRLRDERIMTISAYQTVYQEGVKYGLTKQTESQKGMDELEGQLKALEYKKLQLEKKNQELQSKRESIQQKYRERRVVDFEKREYQIKALMSQNQHLQLFLASRRKQVAEAVQAPAEEQEA